MNEKGKVFVKENFLSRIPGNLSLELTKNARLDRNYALIQSGSKHVIQSFYLISDFMAIFLAPSGLCRLIFRVAPDASCF